MYVKMEGKFDVDVVSSGIFGEHRNEQDTTDIEMRN